MPKQNKQQNKVEVESGADRRLADILKKALNTPPTHVPDKRTVDAKKASSRHK